MYSTRSIIVFLVLAVALAFCSFMLLEIQHALISCLLGWAMLAIAISDAHRFIVPDILSLPAIPAGLLATFLLAYGPASYQAVLYNLAGAIGGALIFLTVRKVYAVWRKREGLGLGDVKLASVAGAWTGLEGLAHVMLLGCILAISYIVLTNARDMGSIKASTRVPFGAFLAPSIWLIWLAQMSGLDFGFAAPF